MSTAAMHTLSVFTIGQVAEICHLAPRTVSIRFDAGKLRGYRVPGSPDRRVPRDKLLDFLNKEYPNMVLRGWRSGKKYPHHRGRLSMETRGRNPVILAVPEKNPSPTLARYARAHLQQLGYRVTLTEGPFHTGCVFGNSGHCRAIAFVISRGTKLPAPFSEPDQASTVQNRLILYGPAPTPERHNKLPATVRLRLALREVQVISF